MQISNLANLEQQNIKRKPARRPPIQRFPNNAKLRYTQSLLKYTKAMFDHTKMILFPQLESIVSQASIVRPRSDVRNDVFSDQISELIIKSRFDLNQDYPDSRLQQIALGVAVEISDFNRKQVTKVLSAVIGVDLFFFEPWLEQEVRAFTKRNVSLIKSIPDRYFAEVENAVYSGVRNGVHHTAIQKQIRERFPVSRNRARLIARDQTNKFNGQLTQLRHQQVGVTKYRWRNVGDQRVRGNPSGRFPKTAHNHWKREGQTFSWNKPPEDGHPGEPVQCRCWAEPLLNSTSGVK